MHLIMAEKESLRVGLATTEQRCHISDNSNIIIIKFCGGVFERLLFSLQTHSSILNLIKLRESARYKTNKTNKNNKKKFTSRFEIFEWVEMSVSCSERIV